MRPHEQVRSIMFSSEQLVHSRSDERGIEQSTTFISPHGGPRQAPPTINSVTGRNRLELARLSFCGSVHHPYGGM